MIFNNLFVYGKKDRLSLTFKRPYQKNKQKSLQLSTYPSPPPSFLVLFDTAERGRRGREGKKKGRERRRRRILKMASLFVHIWGMEGSEERRKEGRGRDRRRWRRQGRGEAPEGKREDEEEGRRWRKRTRTKAIWRLGRGEALEGKREGEKEGWRWRHRNNARVNLPKDMLGGQDVRHEENTHGRAKQHETCPPCQLWGVKRKGRERRRTARRRKEGIRAKQRQGG